MGTEASCASSHYDFLYFLAGLIFIFSNVTILHLDKEIQISGRADLCKSYTNGSPLA